MSCLPWADVAQRRTIRSGRSALHINSLRGSTTAMPAIHDTTRFLRPTVADTLVEPV